MSASFLFKAGCVGMLVVQNSALCLTMRYSRAVLKEQYLTSTTIVLNEVVKLCIALGFMLTGFRLKSKIRLTDLPRHLYSILWCKECLLMGLPGLLYFAMNNLAFIGLENLEASTYSLVSQLKILTTAVFARIMLQKKLWWFQWRALVLLVIGVVLVQSQPTKVPTSSAVVIAPVAAGSSTIAAQAAAATPAKSHPLRHLMGFELVGSDSRVYTPSITLNLPHHGGAPNQPLNNRRPSGDERPLSNSAASRRPSSTPDDGAAELVSAPLLPPAPTAADAALANTIGLGATALAAVLSGFSGCYIEKAMKGGSLSVWDRNVQLALYGIVFGMINIVLNSSEKDRAYAASEGWLGGYSFLACIVVLLNSLGGILVSLVVVYLDNIIRGFATSVAILLTAFVSIVVFHDVDVSIVFGAGVATVLLSVFNYQDSMMASPAEMSSMGLPSPGGATGVTSAVLLSSSPPPREGGSGTIGGGGGVEMQGVAIHRPHGHGLSTPTLDNGAGGLVRGRSTGNLSREAVNDDEKVSLLSR